jgi:predicted kinase
MSKQLILLRGLPGAGKSTLAKVFGVNHIEADMFFIDKATGEYKFDASQLKTAHEWCLSQTHLSMHYGVEIVVVSNTFTQEWEMKRYYELAERNGYMVHSVIVENRHGGVNQHGVPVEKIEQMKNRFEIKL